MNFKFYLINHIKIIQYFNFKKAGGVYDSLPPWFINIDLLDLAGLQELLLFAQHLLEEAEPAGAGLGHPVTHCKKKL